MNFDDIKKMERSEWVTYLDTTPDKEQTFNVLGIGITEMAIAYNPSVDSEKWIIENTARHIHSSNEKQASVSQSIYLGDPCYEFVRDGKGKLNYKTHILDIDMSRKTTGDKYYAELSDGLIAVTSFLGENATIEYDLYYEGEPTIGEVTIVDNKPTFTPTTQTLSAVNMQSAVVEKPVTTNSKNKTTEEF